MRGFPGSTVVKNLPANAGDTGSVPGPGWGRPPGEGNGSPLQYSCLENPMDTGVWWALVYGAVRSPTQLSTHAQIAGKCINETRIIHAFETRNCQYSTIFERKKFVL